MQKGLIIALVAAGIIIAAIAGVITFALGQQDNDNIAPPPASRGKSLTLDLNENLSLKGNT
jgi:hypothetical protein